MELREARYVSGEEREKRKATGESADFHADETSASRVRDRGTQTSIVPREIRNAAQCARRVPLARDDNSRGAAAVGAMQ